MVYSTVYEGDSICNNIVPINREVLPSYALELQSQIDIFLCFRSVFLLNIIGISSQVFSIVIIMFISIVCATVNCSKSCIYNGFSER